MTCICQQNRIQKFPILNRAVVSCSLACGIYEVVYLNIFSTYISRFSSDAVSYSSGTNLTLNTDDYYIQHYHMDAVRSIT